MPGTLELVLRDALKVILTASLAIAWSSAPAQDHTRLIVTANIQNLYPLQSSAPEAKDAAVDFEKRLQAEREASPDAYLIQAANHISITGSAETAYNSPAPKMMVRMNYDVVNLNTRDAALGSVMPVCYQYAPQELLEKTITNMVVTNPQPLPVPIARHVEHKGTAPITVLSLGSPHEVPGLSGQVMYLKETQTADLTKSIADARQRKDLLIAVNSYSSADLKKILPDTKKYPDVIFDVAARESGSLSKLDSTWRIGVPTAGEYLLVDLERDGAGKVAEPKIKRVKYLDADQYKALIEFPIPSIGRQIPNFQSVREQFFPEADRAVGEQRYPFAHPELTNEGELSVYTLQMHDERFHAYRVNAKRMSSVREGFQEPGWPDLDLIVVVNSDHRLERIISRIGFPVSSLETTTMEALGALRNKDPKEWKPDPVYSSGVEEMWDWGAFTIRKVLEIDREQFEKE